MKICKTCTSPVYTRRHVHCEVCRAAKSEEEIKRCAARVASGKCSMCPNDLDREGVMCTACLWRTRKRQRATAKERTKCRVCVACGRKLTEGEGVRCTICLIYHRQNRKKLYDTRKAAGLCTKCGQPAEDGQTRCNSCKKLQAISRRK